MSLSSKINYAFEALSGITVGNINITGNIFQNNNPYIASQWTSTSGNALTYTSGNVIISNGSLVASNLTTGNINFTGTLSQNGSPYIGSQWTGTSGTLYYGTAGSSVVGINTTAPIYTLDVNGTLEASNANGLMLFASTGNLGIGTTAPSTKLDVVGTGRITTSLTTGALYSTNQTTTNIVSTTATITNLNIPGTLTVVNITSTNLVDTNITATSLRVTGTTSVANIYSSLGTISNVVNTNLSTSTLAISSNMVTPRIDIGGTQSTYNNNTLGKLFITGNQNSITGGPNILITTTQDIYPTYNFLTYGHDSAWTMYDMYFDGSFRNSGTSTAFMMVKQSSSLRWNYNTSGFSAGAVAPVSTSICIGSSGNVGLGGQVTPAYTLDVTGNARISSGLTAGASTFTSVSSGDSQFSNLSAGNINFTGNLFQNGSAYIGSQWVGTSGNIYFGTAGSSVVGINTTSPSTTLDVTGTGRITTSLTTGALYSTNQTTTNIVSTNQTTSNITVIGTNTSTNSSSGSVVLLGGLSIDEPTNATSVSNGGALTIAGGAAIGGDLIVGGSILYSNAAAASSTFAYLTLTASDWSTDVANGSLVVYGGISVQNTANATSASSGNGLTIAGGAGIGADLYVGGTSYLPGIVSTTNTTTNLVATGISASNINVSGTLTVVNITSTNLVDTNITASNLRVTGTTSTANIYSSLGTISNLVGTNLSSSNLVATVSTIPNIVHTNMTTTSVLVTGSLSVNNTTDASNISNGGALSVSGGLSVAKKVFIGGEVDINGYRLLGSTTGNIHRLYMTSGFATSGSFYVFGNHNASNQYQTDVRIQSFGMSGVASQEYISIVASSTGNIIQSAAFGDGMISRPLSLRNNTAFITLVSTGTISVLGQTSFSDSISANAATNTIGNIFTTGGNVGINTTSFSSTLEISSTSSPSVSIVSDIANSSGSALYLGGYSNQRKLAFITTPQGSWGRQSLNICINSDATLGSATISDSKITIDTRGNLGIGTTSPSVLLDIATAGSGTKFRMAGPDGGDAIAFSTSTAGGGVVFSMTNNRGAGQIIINQSNAVTGSIRLQTVSIDRVAIQSSRVSISTDLTVATNLIYTTGGNIGIGTTTPAYNLDVVGSGDFSTFVTTGALYSTNQTTTNLVATASTITNLSIPGTLTVVNITSTNLVETNITAGGIVVTGGSLNATFNSNTIGNIFTTGGNVGIGAKTPTTTLHLYSSATEPIIGLQSGNQSVFGFQTISDAGSAGIKIGTFDGVSSISSNVSFFSKTGNVGIGTTAPAYKLDVVGSGDFSTFVTTGALYSTNQTTTNIVSTAISSANVIVNDNLNISGISSFFGGSFSANNNVTSASTVTGLLFPSATVRSFIATLNINISKPSGNLNSTVTLEGTQLDSGWILYDSSLGDSTGLNFTINSSGQVLYTSPNYVGWVSTTIRFEAHYYTLAGTYNPVTLPTSGNVSVTGVLSVNNTSNATSTSSGALTVSGGAGISKSLLVGENLNVGGLSNTFTGSFAAANNVSSATNVTGFLVPTATFSSFTASVNVRILTTLTTLNAQYMFEATQSTGGWLLNDTSFGDSVGITFTITPAGQIQYTSTNVANWQSTTINFAVNAISISSGFTAVLPTSGNVSISGNLTIDSTTDSSSTSAASLVLAGGVGINKSLLVGGNFNIGGVTTQFAGTFSAANSASGASVTGLLFPTATIRSFTCTLSVRVVSSVNYNTQHTIEGVQTATGGWQINDYQIGDASGITFAINSSGQITYTSPTFTSWTSTTMHYNAVAYNISSSYTPIPMPTGGSSSVSGSLVIQSTNIASSTSSGALSVSGGVGIQNNLIVNDETLASGGILIPSTTVLEFGYGVAGKEQSAGKIGYNRFSTGLDIVGAGTSNNNRVISIFDNLSFSSILSNNRLSLYGGTVEHNFYGFGINSGILRYQTSGVGSSHRFYASTSATSSNELMSILGTGNVGIGNTSPTYTLDVNGTLEASNSNGLMLFSSTGNLGIRTTSPSEVLHVNGNIRHTGFNYVSSSTLTTGSAGTVLIATASAGLYSGRISVDAVGVGTHSQFTIDITGTYTEGATSIQTPSIIVKRSQWVGGTNVSNITICTAPTNGTYISNFFLTCTSGVALTIRLLESVDNKLSLTTPALTTLTAGYTQTVYPLIGTGVLNGAMGNYLNVNTGGIGINSTGGTYDLDVSGSVFLGVMPNLNSAGSLRFGRQDTPGIRYHDLEFTTSTTQASSYMSVKLHDGVTTTSQTEVMRLRADGNVGIGTTTPSSKLTINGSETGSNGENAAILIQNTAATSGNKWWLRTGAVGTTTPVGGFSIADNSLYRMVFTSTGNIAIGGITNPATNLHINTSNYAGIQLGNNDSSGWTVAKETGGLLAFYTGAFGAGTFRFGCTSTGNVGIGLASPLYPLHVNGSANTGNVGSYAGYYNVYGWQNQTAVYATSIYTSHFIVAGQGFASLSDTRIKKDIVDLDDNEALISLRAIQPKKYKYKDYYTRGGSEVYGFIAQQVEEVMPYATGTTTDYIPNILKKCNLHVNENGVCVITMKDNDPHGFTSDFNGKIKLFTETEDKIITMKEIINDYTLTINETLPEREYFMYGIEVDDFKILNKDAIFTTSVAAIQQLDRELQDTKQQLASAQTTINQLVSFIQTKFPGEFV